MRTEALPCRHVSALRGIVGAAVIGILVFTYIIGIPRQGPSLFDFFGYFTNLTSLLASLILLTTSLLGLRRRRVPAGLTTARAVVTACMIVVALVYNLIVPGTGSAPAWVSLVLHTVFPLLLVLDWLRVGDRPPQPWRLLWLVLPYPMLWLFVVLGRGVTDGWVPYGFLLPERGVVSLSTTVAALLVALLVAAAAVWALSRVPAPISRVSPWSTRSGR